MKADVKCRVACHEGVDNDNAATLISPIYVRRKVCELGIGMMKENQVKDSGEERREKVGSNGNFW